MLSKITAATLAVSFFALGGCAQTETSASYSISTGQETASVAGKTSVKPEATAARLSTSVDTNASQAALENPAIIEFQGQGLELDNQAQTLITKLAAPAKRAARIVITGYADKRKTERAKEVALSRAAKVKSELVKNGVAAKNIRLKYSTEQTRNVAKVEWSGEPLKVVNSTSSTPKN